MLTVDTWQLGWRPTDIDIANYTYAYIYSRGRALYLTTHRFYYPGTVRETGSRISSLPIHLFGAGWE